MTRIALILGAGGVAGHAFHAGTLAAIAETTGWDPATADLCVGTSAGSMVSAGLRSGFAVPDMLRRALGQPVSPATEALLSKLPPPMEAMPRPGIGERGLQPAALMSYLARPWQWGRAPTRLGPAVAAALPEGSVDAGIIEERSQLMWGRPDWPSAPTWIVAFDLERGRRVVFGRDGAPETTLGRAVSASCCIPGFFAPVTIDGRRHVDGGVHSPTNADLAAGGGFDLVIVSSPMSASRSAQRQLRPSSVQRAFLGRVLARETLKLKGTPVVTFQPSGTVVEAMGANPLDMTKVPDIATAAHAAALKRLQKPSVVERLRALR